MLIELDGVSHAYPGRADPVVLDLNVRLEEPRIGVIGANGSGKSTFARMLNGLVVPSAGRVRIDGLDTRRHGREVRKRVGFCFTDPDSQIVMPTVAEDVAFGLRRRGLSKAEIAARVHDVLASYGLDRYAEHAAHLLSGGQKQLLALVSILITEPGLVVTRANPPRCWTCATPGLSPSWSRVCPNRLSWSPTISSCSPTSTGCWSSTRPAWSMTGPRARPSPPTSD